MSSDARARESGDEVVDGLIPLREGTPATVTLESQEVAYLRDEWTDDVNLTPEGAQFEVEVSNQAGVIGLPSGRVLSIQPKITTNLLYMLSYAERISEDIISGAADAGYEVGDSLIELLGQLFLRELKRVLRRGLAQEFRETEATQRHLRGQLQMEKQFQRQGAVPLQFECRYQELTQDTAHNRVVLAAIQALSRLVTTPSLRNELVEYRERFEKRVSVPDRPLRELSDVTVTHLTAHYRDLILLSEVILQEQFIRELGQPDPRFPSFVFEMPGVFEDSVVKAVRAAIDQSRFRVTTNDLGVLARIDGADGEERTLEPDFIIRRRTGQPASDEPVLIVGDAKWKETASPSRNDLYQLATYQAKFGTPGILVYPAPQTDVQKTYTYDDANGSDANRDDLIVTQLAVGPVDAYDTYVQKLEYSLQPVISRLLAGE